MSKIISVKHAIKEILEWADDDFNKQFMFEEPRVNIKESLAAGDPWDVSAVDLDMLATWYFSKAMADYVREKDSALDELVNTCVTTLCAMRIARRQANNTGNKNIDIAAIFYSDPVMHAYCLASSMIIGATELSESLNSELNFAVDNCFYRDKVGSDVAVFMSELYKISEHGSLARTIDNHIHMDLLRTIHEGDVSGINGAVKAAVEYHVSRSRYGNKNQDFEFDTPEYIAYPAWIKAALSVCKAKGYVIDPITNSLFINPLSGLVRESDPVEFECKDPMLVELLSKTTT